MLNKIFEGIYIFNLTSALLSNDIFAKIIAAVVKLLLTVEVSNDDLGASFVTMDDQPRLLIVLDKGCRFL